MAQRVVFSFDERIYSTLKEVQENGEFPSMGTAVRESIQLSDILQEQAAEGYTEVIVRNPKTNMQKILVIPSLKRAAKRRNKD